MRGMVGYEEAGGKGRLDERLTVRSGMLCVGGGSRVGGLGVGEKVRMGELLKGMLMGCGKDGGKAIGVRRGGSEWKLVS